MEKIIERIIERVPDGLALQIQTLGNEIFDLLDSLSESNAKLKIENEFYSEETAKKDILINGKNN